MKTQNWIALMSLLSSVHTYAQTGSTEDLSEKNYLALSDAKTIFKNFGVKKLASNIYQLQGTIPTVCVNEISIIVTDAMDKDGFAGGWKIKDKNGKAVSCVEDFFKTNKCGYGTCSSLSDDKIAPKLTAVDSADDAKLAELSVEELEKIPGQKIGLFHFDYSQDVSSQEFIQADEIDPSVTFESVAVSGAIASANAKMKAQKEEEALRATAGCEVTSENRDEVKNAINELLKLGKMSQEEAKKKLNKMDDEEFQADLESASTIALSNRQTLLDKLNKKWKHRLEKDADRIADAKLEIVRRIMTGTEAMEEGVEPGLVRADFIEAREILASIKSKGLSKSKSVQVATELTSIAEKRVDVLAARGELTSSDTAALSRVYQARAAKVCSPQDRIQQAQLRAMQSGQNNAHAQSGFNFNMYSYRGRNTGHLPQQSQQQNANYNSELCWNTFQTEMNLAYKLSDSNRIKQQLAGVNQQNGAGGYQQVGPNIFSADPAGFQNSMGMGNNVFNPNVYNPNAAMAMTYSPMGMNNYYSNYGQPYFAGSMIPQQSMPWMTPGINGGFPNMYNNSMMFNSPLMYPNYGMPGMGMGINFGIGAGMGMGSPVFGYNS